MIVPESQRQAYVSYGFAEWGSVAPQFLDYV